MTNRTLTIFPILALFTTGLSLWANELLSSAQPAIVPCLSIIMFMMGLTLLVDCILISIGASPAAATTVATAVGTTVATAGATTTSLHAWREVAPSFCGPPGAEAMREHVGARMRGPWATLP